MNALTLARDAGAMTTRRMPGLYEDPLDPDAPTDVFVPATRRGLTRLALVAAETGARFQREGGGSPDPMAWLLSPRRLFDGDTAIEACLRSREFSRALLLHGLSLGLDADPAEVDELLDDEVDGLDRAADAAHPPAPHAVAAMPAARPLAPGGRSPLLFTATIVHEEDGRSLQAFHASVGSDRAEVVARIVDRYGPAAARTAVISVGFDPTTAFAEALVSPAIGDMLHLVEAEPASPIAAGLDLNLEQRFAA